MSSLLLTGGRVIDPSQHLDQNADLLISEGKIAALDPGAAKKSPRDAERVDVTGLAPV